MKGCFSCLSPQKRKAPGSHDGGDDGAGPSAPAPPPSRADSGEGASDVPPEAEGVHRFTFSELEDATGKFRQDNYLGQGGFGRVYRGYLNSGQHVAVKFLRRSGMQGVKEFLTEVRFLYTLDHPNLVKLLGVCTENNERLLVYEYMPRGSLDSWISDPDRRRNLEWNQRMKIAHDSAKGLLHLHDESFPQIIHRDLKSSNILLDGAFNAKLSDFGVARFGRPDERTQTATHIVGTPGYLDPDYMLDGILSAKSDVYSFGVILLELLTGRMAKVPGAPLLTEVASRYLDGRLNFTQLADGFLIKDRYPEHAFEQIARVALRCIHPAREQRPPMREVVDALENVTALI